MEWRRTIREVGLKRRYGAMSAGEGLHEEQCLQAMALVFAASVDADNPEEEADLLIAGALIAAEVVNARVDRTVIRSVTGRSLVIDDIAEEEAWGAFRFRKRDMRRLFTVMQFPPVWICKNKSRFPGETALLLLLRRLRYPGRLSDLEKEFGREYTQLARLFREVIDFMCEEHTHRITAFLGYWEPLDWCYGRIGCMGSEICGFFDGTLRRTCRQVDDDLQRENYDGHHRTHGLAFQSVVLPNGMIGDMWGPAPGRRHDAFILRESGLNSRLAALQEGKPFQGKTYGDAAYPVLSHVDRGYRGANLTAAQRAYNKEPSRVRISVEWQFGTIVQLFPFVDFKQNMQLMLSPVGKFYKVAALLTNAHTTSYGCATSKYFGMLPPTLEQYFED